ncbi:MAG: Crp/Fnr family transcriptional regulator, partial [Gammaproteobacteria bacterium]|nr:Crp/Fnr family transcriptional regulator [Gammaproteobacteria bacterium]
LIKSVILLIIPIYAKVSKGELRAIRYQLSGQKSTLMRATDYEFFATSSLCLNTYSCDGFAPVKTTLWRIPKDKFYQLLEVSAILGKQFSLALSKELKKQCGRIERLRLKTTQERILHFINCEAHDGVILELNMSLSVWAEELGIEPESLYRTLAKMENIGLIKRNRRLIRILESK